MCSYLQESNLACGGSGFVLFWSLISSFQIVLLGYQAKFHTGHWYILWGISECGFLVKKLIDPARVIASCGKERNLPLFHRCEMSPEPSIVSLFYILFYTVELIQSIYFDGLTLTSSNSLKQCCRRLASTIMVATYSKHVNISSNYVMWSLQFSNTQTSSSQASKLEFHDSCNLLIYSVLEGCEFLIPTSIWCSFAKLLSRKPWHYNLMIREFGYHHDLQHAFAILEIMKEEGVAPDVYTYRALIDTCGRANEPSKAAVVFKVCWLPHILL